MSVTGPPDLVGAYLDHALAGDVRKAVDVTLGLLDAGFPEEMVITDLLAAAQRQVGERWQANELSVADEHVATGVTQSALHALASAAEAPGGAGVVVVACAEGDWHAIASEMFAEQLRSRGFIVAFLGPSTPAAHVARFVERHRPDALAVTCNLPLFFRGVARLADVAHAIGVPVLAGGRALQDGAARARLVGADGWAQDVAGAVAVLDAWRGHRVELRPAPTMLDQGAVELEDLAPSIAAAALEELVRTLPAMADRSPSQIARTREDLTFIVRFAAAAQLVDDELVFTGFLDWLDQVLGARDVPTAVIAAGLEALRPLLGQVSDTAGHLADLGLRHLSRSPRRPEPQDDGRSHDG